jgi:hypothetical protein
VKIHFLIDTGAEVTLLSEENYMLLDAADLKQSEKYLKGPSNDSLKTKAYFQGMLSSLSNNQSTKKYIYVVRGPSGCLLWQPAIES